MNTTHLTSFLALADSGSYQKAADRLHYSRSTIMDHVHALEQELGVPLIYTKGRRLMLTEAGDKFRVHALSMLQIYNAALIDVAKPDDNLSLHILTVETIALNFLNEPLSLLLGAYPDIDLSIEYVPLHKMQEALLSGRADIAFEYTGYAWEATPDPGLKSVLICQDEAVFFASPKHPLSSKPDISLSDIAGSWFVLTIRGGLYSAHLARIFTDTGIRIVPKQYIDSGTLLKQFVCANNCVSMISRRMLRDELESGRLAELRVPIQPLTSNLMAIYPRSKSANPALNKLIRLTIGSLK